MGSAVRREGRQQFDCYCDVKASPGRRRPLTPEARSCGSPLWGEGGWEGRGPGSEGQLHVLKANASLLPPAAAPYAKSKGQKRESLGCPVALP